MKIIEATTVNDAYSQLMDALLMNGEKVADTKEIRNCIVIVKEPSLDNMHFRYRPLSMKYAMAELEWYWTGNNSCHAIGQHAKKWLSITDDGRTSNSAYGYILFKKYNKNQLEEIIEMLQKDPESRRAVLNISDPTLDKIKTKDMQCTVSLQFFVRDGKLHTTVYMRSNDVYYGFPYDYIFFVSIANYIALRLGLDLGEYVHHAGSMHIYDSSRSKLSESNATYTIDVNRFYEMYEQMKGSVQYEKPTNNYDNC